MLREGNDLQPGLSRSGKAERRARGVRGLGGSGPRPQLAEAPCICKPPRRAETAGEGPKAPSCQMRYVCGGEQCIRISLRTRKLFGGVQNT